MAKDEKAKTFEVDVAKVERLQALFDLGTDRMMTMVVMVNDALSEPEQNADMVATVLEAVRGAPAMLVVNPNRYFTLDKASGTITPCSVEEWSEWMKTADRAVAKYYEEGCDDAAVSTVFIGADMRWGMPGPPLLFETMILEGDRSGEQWRCSTLEEARKQHDEALARYFTVEVRDENLTVKGGPRCPGLGNRLDRCELEERHTGDCSTDPNAWRCGRGLRFCHADDPCTDCRGRNG